MSTPILYSAVLGTVFILGAAGFAALAVYLLERVATRRPQPRPADPYAAATALADRVRADRVPVGRARVPLPGKASTPWS